MLARTKTCLTFAFLGSFALPASAAYHWDFATGSNLIVPSSFCGGSQSFTFGNCDTWGSTPSGGGNVDVRAYSSTGSTTSTGTIQAAYLDVFGGGLGVTNSRENTGPSQTGTSGLYPSNQAHPTVAQPNHAIDNLGNTDSVLLSFANSIDLTGVVLGWPTSSNSCSPAETTCDTDISIWAYTGPGGSPDPNSQTYGALTGWTLVNYMNVPVGSTQLINGAANVDSTTGIKSNYWLISAYYSSSALSATNNDLDFVKLQAVYGTNGKKVPEPGSLLLLLAAAVGGGWVRRARAH